jgi:hypothetical protein
MSETSSRLSLSAKALYKVWVIGVLRKQHLERNRTIKQKVMRQKNLGHAATTDAALDAVSIIDYRHIANHCY